MNLEKHISQLLYRYQCVSVPGFGAFLTEIVSAQLIITSNSFYPPKKLISFNANLKNNDGLLANQIAAVEKISYAEAVRKIGIEIENWRNNLEAENNLILKNIGSLTLNVEKKIVFIPTESFNYLETSFGLTSFVSPNVKREVFETKIIEPVFEKNKTTKSILEEENELIAFELEFEKPSRSYSNLKYAAVFLIGCGIASPVFLNLYKEKIAIDNMIVEAVVQKKVDTKIQEATFLISNPLSEMVLNEKKENYHVVAGAFKLESNANKVYKHLIKQGFNAKKTNNSNGLFSVIYESYKTYGEARNAMTTIQKNNNSDAWILIQELEN